MTVETKAYDGKIVVNSLNSMFVQTTLLLNLPMVYKAKSTLNEHLGINKNTLPDPSDRPTMVYLAIGNKGHTFDESIGTPLPITHQPTDTAPYGIMPFVLRPIDKDLDDVQRQRYALRMEVEYNGKRYYAYYLRRQDYRGVKVENFLTEVQDGQETVNQFEFTKANLHPKPSSMPDYDYEVADQIVPDDGDYVSSVAMINVEFDAFDVQEYQNVAKVMFNNPNAAVLSEIIPCTGFDMMASGESALGSPFQYMEAMGVQCSIFLTTFTNLALQNAGMAWRFGVGQTQPMALAPGQTPSAEDTVVRI